MKQSLPIFLCILLAIFAGFLKFFLKGYSFSALVVCFLIALILFYTITAQLSPRFPQPMQLLRRIVSICLCLGFLLVAATEVLIIRASFGSREQNAAYIVVLGAKVNDYGPSPSLWDRIYGAADYLTTHPDSIAVLSGGQGKDEPMSEAQAMFQELVALDISPERLLLEDKAKSTWENLNFSLDLIQQRTGSRPDTLGVLSSEYHLFRASLFAKSCGVDFVGIPARTSKPGQTINHFLREIAGVWHYILLESQYRK